MGSVAQWIACDVLQDSRQGLNLAGGIDWFRWHHGSVTDPKFALVARRAGASLPDVLAVWAFLLEKASAAETRGTFSDIDCEAVDCLFGFPEERTAAILKALSDRNLVGDGQVIAWEKRQPKREREDNTAAERKRAQRERESHQQEPDEATDSHVTPRHATSRQEKPRGEESRGEKNEAKASSARPARTCPEAFSPPEPEAWIAENCPGLDWRLETVKFRDHEFASPKRDWLKAWRNWMRRAHETRRPGAVVTPINRQEAIEARNRAVGDEWVRQQEAMDASR